MKKKALFLLFLICWGALTAQEAGEFAFPERFSSGVRYAVVNRGTIREEIFADASVLAAVQRGESIPRDSVITLVDYRDGELFRYVVMEKTGERAGATLQDGRVGEWQFAAFNGDRTVNRRENLARCVSCHRPQERAEFLFTLGQMRAFRSAPIDAASKNLYATKMSTSPASSARRPR